MQSNSLKTLAILGILSFLLAVGMSQFASRYNQGTEEDSVILSTTMWEDSSVLVNLIEGKHYHLTVKRVTKPEERKNLSYKVYIEKANSSLNLIASGSGYMDFILGKEYTWTFTPEQGGDCHLWIVNNARCSLHTTQFQVTLRMETS